MYGVAYNDKYDLGYDCNHPWIYGYFANEDNAKIEALRLRKDGYKSVTVFTLDGEDINWEFIRTRQINF